MFRLDKRIGNCAEFVSHQKRTRARASIVTIVKGLAVPKADPNGLRLDVDTELLPCAKNKHGDQY